MDFRKVYMAEDKTMDTVQSEMLGKILIKQTEVTLERRRLDIGKGEHELRKTDVFQLSISINEKTEHKKLEEKYIGIRDN